MKKTFCILLALTMLFAAGCSNGTARFAVIAAKSVIAEKAERVSAADTAKGFSELGLTERLFTALYEEGENLAYSPVSIYLALAMLAETAAGETREEILAALGADGIEEVRSISKALLTGETIKEEKAECSMANSLWMNESVGYIRPTLETIAEIYRTDSFSGNTADPSYSKALREWLDTKTNGLLKDGIKTVKLEPDTVLAIASTVYFDAEWRSEFEKKDNFEGVFRSPDGDVPCEFMYQTDSLYYAEGEGFRAAGKSMMGDTVMWFILPDEGASLSSALGGIAALDTDEFRSVKLTMPKLDVTSDIDLLPVFRRLGLSLCMDPYASDFSPLFEDPDGIFVSGARHAARVKADEKRVRAAAFTLITMDKAAAPSFEIEFTLDRPFIFVITGASGAPLFVGAVNEP